MRRVSPPCADAKRCLEQMWEHMELNLKNRVQAKTGHKDGAELSKLFSLMSHTGLSHPSKPRTPLSPSRLLHLEQLITIPNEQKMALREVFIFYCGWAERHNYLYMSRSQFLRCCRDTWLMKGDLDAVGLSLLFEKILRVSSAKEAKFVLEDFLAALMLIATRSFPQLSPQEAWEKVVNDHVLLFGGGMQPKEDWLAPLMLQSDVVSSLSAARLKLKPVFRHYVNEQLFGGTQKSAAALKPNPLSQLPALGNLEATRSIPSSLGPLPPRQSVTAPSGLTSSANPTSGGRPGREQGHTSLDTADSLQTPRAEKRHNSFSGGLVPWRSGRHSLGVGLVGSDAPDNAGSKDASNSSSRPAGPGPALTTRVTNQTGGDIAPGLGPGLAPVLEPILLKSRGEAVQGTGVGGSRGQSPSSQPGVGFAQGLLPTSSILPAQSGHFGSCVGYTSEVPSPVGMTASMGQQGGIASQLDQFRAVQTARSLLPMPAFIKLLHDFGIMPALLNKAQASLCFRLARFGPAGDQGDGSDIGRIDFDEFMEALGRCALLAFNFQFPKTSVPVMSFTQSYEQGAKALWSSVDRNALSQSLSYADEITLPAAERDVPLGNEDSPHYDEITIAGYHGGMGSRSRAVSQCGGRARSVKSMASGIFRSAKSITQLRFQPTVTGPGGRQGEGAEVMAVHGTGESLVDERPLHLAQFSPDWVGAPKTPLTEAARLVPCAKDPVVSSGVYSGYGTGLPPLVMNRMGEMVAARIVHEQASEALRLVYVGQRRLAQKGALTAATRRRLELQEACCQGLAHG